MTACGGAPTTPVETPSGAAPPAAASAPEQPAGVPSAASTDEPEPGAADAKAEEPAAPSAEPREREVKYVVTGGKLEIRVEGARFRPTAKAVRVGGGWGVRLTVEGEVDDDKLLSVLEPKRGALMFGGKVLRKGEAESIVDQREGGEEAMVAPGTPKKMVRDWPGKSGNKPLAKGDKLELHVGLWGIGPDADARRPLNRLLILTMSVTQGEPRPMIAPPQ
jgi:hypothetical protein